MISPKTRLRGHWPDVDMRERLGRAMLARVICDSNIHDAIASDPALKQRVEQCWDTGRIAFRTTHVKIVELTKTPSHSDLGQAAAVDAKRISASALALGYSPLDEDRLGGPETDSAFAAIQNGGLRHTEDATIEA
jgi:hypothetical protein